MINQQNVIEVKNKLLERLYFFYVKNLRYRLIQLKALLKEEKRKIFYHHYDKKENNDNNQKIFFEGLDKKEILNEINFTMDVLKNNIDDYFSAKSDEEKINIFNNFMQNIKK